MNQASEERNFEETNDHQTDHGVSNNRESEQLTARITLRFHPAEIRKIETERKQTSCNSISAYIREKTLQQPVTQFTRDRSLDAIAEALIQMKKELNGVGRNLNQAVRKLHTLDNPEQQSAWFKHYENDLSETINTIDRIYDHITEFAKIWMQK